MSTLQNQAGSARAAGMPAVRPSKAKRDHGPAVRASDADRDHTAGLLNAAFAEGRLTTAEHAQRLDAAYAARTQPQLRQLVADLPASDPAPGRGRAMNTVADRCLLGALFCMCPPAAIAWWLLSRLRPPRDHDRPRLAAAEPEDSRLDAQDGLHAQGR